MTDCLFCNIASEDQDAEVVHRSENVVAFRDINPQAPTHILLIPVEHVPSAAALREQHADVLLELFRAAEHLARSEGIAEGGWRLVTNVGPDAGQSVAHLHFHLLGGRGMTWPPG
ncbi:MAG: histidine triad nucleotide-binding protein [Actinobacteria bacterium]|nr:histidine triad nucleotide-binding protein [Actinomycetota bacterium]